MDIYSYCRHAGISVGRFAALADIRPDKMQNYALGRDRPGPRVMGRIITASGGLITPEDFPELAIHVDADPKPVRIAVPIKFHDGGLPHGLSPPLVSAMEEFGNGATYLPAKGVFVIDGRSLTPPQLIARANQKRQQRGVKPIHYPGVLTPQSPKREEP